MAKVIIRIQGGLVQSVMSTDPDLEVKVLDQDLSSNADDEEITALEKLEERLDEEMKTMTSIY